MIKCDMCGAQVNLRELRILAHLGEGMNRDELTLCETCGYVTWEHVKTFITKMKADIDEPLKIPGPPEQASEPAPARRKKKPIDKGKIMALHRAGWPDRKIADDVGCSYSYVSKVILESEGNDMEADE